MAKRWYRMEDSLDATPGRWYLSSPRDARGNEIEPRLFSEGQPVEVLIGATSGPNEVSYHSTYAKTDYDWSGDIVVPIQYEGVPLGFTFAALDMPVLRRDVTELLERYAPGDFQRFPARVQGHEGDYDIVNIIHKPRCVDESRTEYILKWTTEDHRADLAGRYRSISGLKVLPEALAGIHLARVWGFSIMLLCSEVVKDALESAGVTGVKFEDVT